MIEVKPSNSQHCSDSIVHGTIVEIEKLTYCYPKESKETLENVSMKIEANELVVLVGKTGSGKTTLAMCLNGLIPQVLGGKIEGSISINGFSPSKKRIGEMATKVGLAFQDSEAQLVNLYVEDEIAFGCENICLPRKEIERRIERFSEAFRISHLKRSFCHTLSAGQKHKVAMASVLAMEPRLLVLDEPFADLDPRSATDLLECIDRLRWQKDQFSVLVMEHKIDDLAARASRIALLDEGRIVTEGEPRKVFAEHGEYMFVELGLRIPQVAELAIKLSKSGIILKPFPLTPNEAYETILDLDPQFRSAPYERMNKKTKRSLLEIEGLSFAYPKSSINVLKDVNLKISQGEFIGVVGANAAGKTTLAKNIVGLLRPNEGKIFLDGNDVSSMPISAKVRKVGYVFQRPECQFVRETVKDDIDFSISMVKKTNPKIEDDALKLLEQFELVDHLKSHVNNLSRGQKRRLGIISMLMLGQKILILDEPTTGQDWKATTTLMNLLRKVNVERSLTVIVITHDMRIVAEWIDRAIVMNEGRIIYDGKVRNLFRDAKLVQQASLKVPHIVELSNLFSQNGRLMHGPLLTVEEFLKNVEFNQ